MGYKRFPTDDELTILSDQFRALWTPGTPIRSWLRKHAAEIQKVRGEWSWAAIAAALDQAGIGYQPKVRANPARRDPKWSPAALKQEFSRAKAPLKGYVKAKRRAPEPAPDPYEAIALINRAAGLAAPVARAAPAVDLQPIVGPLMDVRQALMGLRSEVADLMEKTAVPPPQPVPAAAYSRPSTVTLSQGESKLLKDIDGNLLKLIKTKTLYEEGEAEKALFQASILWGVTGLVAGIAMTSVILVWVVPLF
jgi:hypothetical protein